MTTHPVSIALTCRGSTWLVARRHPHAHLGGQWEFPGGKREPGESAEGAALRELFEECGVRAVALARMNPRRVEYADRVVELTPVVCRWISGAAVPHGSAECGWMTMLRIRQLRMPEVNRAILDELCRMDSIT